MKGLKKGKDKELFGKEISVSREDFSEENEDKKRGSFESGLLGRPDSPLRSPGKVNNEKSEESMVKPSKFGKTKMEIGFAEMMRQVASVQKPVKTKSGSQYQIKPQEIGSPTSKLGASFQIKKSAFESDYLTGDNKATNIPQSINEPKHAHRKSSSINMEPIQFMNKPKRKPLNFTQSFRTEKQNRQSAIGSPHSSIIGQTKHESIIKAHIPSIVKGSSMAYLHKVISGGTASLPTAKGKNNCMAGALGNELFRSTRSPMHQNQTTNSFHVGNSDNRLMKKRIPLKVQNKSESINKLYIG